MRHRKVKNLLASALALFCLSAAISAQNRNVDQKSTAYRADKYLNGLVKEDRFSGAVLLARGGKIVLSRGYGLANRETKTPNSPRTKIRLGSLTKQFTAAAILLLRERGKLRTSDSICKYVSDCPGAWEPVTIHHLLTHTSGIPSYTGLPDFRKLAVYPATPTELIARFRDKQLEFAPGKEFSYNNSGYVLLGHVVEKVSGNSYAEFLRENVFRPLGMNDTGYDENDAVIENRADGYTPTPRGIRRAPYIDMTVPFAAGGLYSTAEDMYLWAKALAAGKLLSKESLDAMHTPFKNGYGYGVFIGEQYGLRNITHGGGIEGASTLLSRFPNEDAVVIVLSNIDSVFTDGYGKRLGGVLLADKVNLPGVINVPARELRQFEGRYQVREEAPTEDIFLVGDRLRVKVSGGGAMSLEPVARDEFVVGDDFEARYTFTRDDKGKVNAAVFKFGKTERLLKRITPPAPSLVGNTTFRLKGYENARFVNLAGSLNDWKPSTIMCGREGAEWVCRVDLKPGKYLYKFIVDGDWITDPGNPRTEGDENGNNNSVMLVP
jgi:CubicO group peptidase (beta-lactamase class C family)